MEEFDDGLAVQAGVGEAEHVPRTGEHDLTGVREPFAQFAGGLFADKLVIGGRDQQRGDVDARQHRLQIDELDPVPLAEVAIRLRLDGEEAAVEAAEPATSGNDNGHARRCPTCGGMIEVVEMILPREFARWRASRRRAPDTS